MNAANLPVDHEKRGLIFFEVISHVLLLPKAEQQLLGHLPIFSDILPLPYWHEKLAMQAKQ